MATVSDLQTETVLLKKIHRTLPASARQRYEHVVAKSQAEALTNREHAELRRLTARIEALQASRVEAMAELARLRHVSLAQLREELERAAWCAWVTN